MSGHDARGRILGHVREALSDRSKPDHPGPLVPSLLEVEQRSGSAADLPSRFTERFEANGGEVVSFDSLEAAAGWIEHLEAELTPAGAEDSGPSVSVGVAVPAALHLGVSPAPAEHARLGISWGAWACARTGTVLLDSRDGRRTQLFPPVHVVCVATSCVVDTLAAALARAREDLPSAFGLHSGPSKSADIGRIIVTGVHGPGRLIVALVPG